jgi:hypothetical protein
MQLSRDWAAVEQLAARRGLVLAPGSRLDAFTMTGSIEGAKVSLGCSLVLIGRGGGGVPMTSVQVDAPPDKANLAIVVWSRRHEVPGSLPLEVATGDAAFDRRLVCNIGHETISGDPYRRPSKPRTPILAEPSIRRALVELDERLEQGVGPDRHLQLNTYSRGLIQLHFTGLAINDVWILDRALELVLALRGPRG